MRFAVKAPGGWGAWDHTDPIGQGGAWTVAQYRAHMAKVVSMPAKRKVREAA